VVGRIASQSHGVVTRDELLWAGVSHEEIRVRLHKGSLIRVHAGVYRAGHTGRSVEARYMAAVRACGERALLCGRAAAYVWGLIKGKAPQPEVRAPTKRRVAGVVTRRCRSLDPRDATVHRGIPVATVARTLVDLAAELNLGPLARACHEAGVRYGTTPAEVEAVLRQRPNAAGAGRLRRILHGDVRVTLSNLEATFIKQLRKAGLPLPVTNRPAGGRRVDCRWRERRLTVELDGYRYHRSRHAWEQDRRREREAYARGDEFRRYTYGDVFEQPRLMLRELQALLSSERPG
jgi:very-short-patch-repair endonuclease